jgi:hypothetical protein
MLVLGLRIKKLRYLLLVGVVFVEWNGVRLAEVSKVYNIF